MSLHRSEQKGRSGFLGVHATHFLHVGQGIMCAVSDIVLPALGGYFQRRYSVREYFDH
jgi:hypothetical protein